MSITKLILMTGSNEKYINKIKPYLDSIDNNSNFDLNFLIYLSDNDIQLDNKINVLKLSPSKYIHRNSINCVQHGEFIKADGFDDLIEDDDVIVFTDGDMILQRNLSEDELMKFRNLKHGDVFIGYNESPNDNLLKEYSRLLPTGYIPKIFKIDLAKIKCYNSGVIGATKSTFKEILNHYSKLYDEVDKMLGYYAKQQWLISYIIGTENFNVIEMGYEMHNHTHYKAPEGSEINNKIVTYNNQVVLFKHKWDFLK
jgi:hypothetical protein